MTASLSQKADTLESLCGKLKTGKVLPQIRFTVDRWRAEPGAIAGRIRDSGWLDDGVIVRSSALDEDGEERTLAGHYDSVLDVKDETGLTSAIEDVASSFDRNNGMDSIFVQPMLRDVLFSGVAFNRDPSTGADYLIVNYDDRSGSTESVTAGRGLQLETFYCFRKDGVRIPPKLRQVFLLMEELEGLFGHIPLDMEFAVTSDFAVYLFQIRSLPVPPEYSIKRAEHQASLADIEKKLASLMQPHPYLHGPKTVFGSMPDWNPAEIIGQRPKPLSLSLYKELVTDNIWAYQRDNYGYRNLRSFPLMHSLCGQPYIDVRVSFNSFIPADVDSRLAEKLATYYIDRLVENPVYHDKVEFEIIYSCYTFDLAERVDQLSQWGFTEDERTRLVDSLKRLTEKIIHRDTGLWRSDIERIGELERRQATILQSDLDHLSKIYWLIEDCKRYGTLPFAGLARAGFIAVQLLHSMVKVGVFTREDFARFMESTHTVSSDMGKDFIEMKKHEFLARYGHLRPGTYDILSPRYDEAPETYFDWSQSTASPKPVSRSFSFTQQQKSRVSEILRQQGMDLDPSGLLEFIKSAIEGREYAKFIFTRSLSDAMVMFREFGRKYGFDAEASAYSDIDTIRHLYSSTDNPATIIANSIARGRARYKLTQAIILSPLILDPEDVWSFHQPPSRPNFVTHKRTRGNVVVLQPGQYPELVNSIVFMENADPGFDWIFSHSVRGFVTEYGGVNSHMAIRAAELGIPAVIGAGRNLFEQWSRAGLLEIDGAAEQVRILR